MSAARLRRALVKELAAVERGKVLRGEAGIAARKRKDISFDKAAEEFLKWAEANRKPRTAGFYRDCLQALGKSFHGINLSEIHPFLIEKHADCQGLSSCRQSRPVYPECSVQSRARVEVL